MIMNLIAQHSVLLVFAPSVMAKTITIENLASPSILLFWKPYNEEFLILFNKNAISNANQLMRNGMSNRIYG